MSNNGPITVRTLIVDDQQNDRKALRRAFEAADAKDYIFEVEEAESVQDYHQKIVESAFDVLVVDVRLGAKQDGVDDIVDFHQLYAPATIIVVCSWFDGLDPLQTCVRAIRAGAIDCLSKEDPDPCRRVLGSVLDELRRRNSPDDSPSPAWLEQNIKQLSQKYPGQAVAMIGQKVVASAPTVADLREKLPTLNLSHTPFFMLVPPGER